VLLPVLTPAMANAHAVLESSSPAKDSSIATAPTEVVLTFGEPVMGGFTELALIGPDGTSHWEAGKPIIGGEKVSAPLKQLGETGKYTIQYRVTSDDGHPVSGSLSFTLTAASSTSPTPAPAPVAATGETPTSSPTFAAPASEDGLPVWPWIAGAVVLLGFGAAVAVRIGRGTKQPGT
jgi:methionine-rich copper-binding protein CopC